MCGGGEGGGELKRKRTADRCVCWGRRMEGITVFRFGWHGYICTRTPVSLFACNNYVQQ